MRRAHLVLSCLLLLAAPLTVNAPVWAQNAGNAPAPQDPIATERLERRELREEREQLRAEHDQLEAEHDRLKSECMDAKGQDRTTCEEKKQALRERWDDLHRRMKEFHEKAEREHQQTPPAPPTPAIHQGLPDVTGQPQPAHP